MIFCGRLRKMIISHYILVYLINYHIQRENLVTFFAFSKFPT